METGKRKEKKKGGALYVTHAIYDSKVYRIYTYSRYCASSICYESGWSSLWISGGGVGLGVCGVVEMR